MMQKRKEYSRTKNSMFNLLASLGGQFLSTILRFAVRTVFINVLGKSYLGINGYFSDILNMLSLTELGIDTAINYKLYKPLAEHDEKRVRVLLKFYKSAYRAIALVILALGLLLVPVLPFIIKNYENLATIGINVPLVYILFLMQSVSSYMFFAYRSAIMKANQKRYILDLVDNVIIIGTNIAQIIILVKTKNFVIYTASVIVFKLIMNFINACITQWFYPEYFIKEPDSLEKTEIRDLFKDCGALFVYKANTVVLKGTDNMVLGTFLGMDYVGLYSNYLLFYVTIKSYLGMIYSAVRASAGNLFATEDVDVQYRFFQTMNYLTIVLFGTACVGVSACGDELLNTWIGNSYVIAQPFAILIGIEILMYGLKLNLGQIRTITGVFRQAWKRPILSVIINLVTSIILVQVIGIYGVIIGTILSDMLTNLAIDPKIIHQYSFNNYRPVSEYYKKNIIYLSVLFFIGVFDIWLCSWLFIGHGWFSVILHIFVVGVSVPLFLVILFWKSQECSYLRRVIVNILKRTLRKGSVGKAV